MSSARRISAWIFGLFLTVLLAACAGPRYTQMANSMPPIPAGQGRIVFYTPLGSASGPSGQPRIHLNKEVVGRAKSGGFFYVDRPTGSYVITDKGWTSDGLSFMLNPGETRYVRFAGSSLGSTGAGKLDIELVDSPSEAQRDLLSLRYFGGTPAVQAAAQQVK
jgi:hypothetical protein